VFSNVSSNKAQAKLRLLYECAPIALIIEYCGGASIVDPLMSSTPISVLDLSIDDLDKRVGICYGGT